MEDDAPFRLGYRPQLDGIRALAVVGVVAFHASITGAQGGNLGVEPFFVLSGFLITALLAQEHIGDGGVRLGAFYARRALRLLPALGAFLLVAFAYSRVRPDAPENVGFDRDLLATLGYVANWSMAFKDTFETHLLSHTWTLAIEEQFYLLWPLALVALLRRRGDLRLPFVLACAGAVGLTAWRVALYRSGASLPRVAWALDTRVPALLIGAALGLGAVLGWLPRSRAFARIASTTGFLALLFVFLSHRYGIAAISFDPGRQFVEGVLVADVASALLLVGVLDDARWPVTRLLTTRPAIWIGKVSYGLYLWHAAVFQVLIPERTGLAPMPNQALRLAVTAVLVLASYHLVELPFLRRKGRFERRRDLTAPIEETSERVPVPTG
jgi:peptidoglycan/LPS O-acetylase OafA/YrhL